MAKQTSRHFGGNKKAAPVGSGAAKAPRSGGLPSARDAAKNIAKRKGGSAPRQASGVPARRQIKN